ncbi:hypothetical protein BKH46_08545, partial [Helicobacter sp. 12S02634-8]|uniref:zinc-ribbon domain and TM2 domain-containing protein n=1 Tax=Helicobacter sp. 12S02634-8 TaxID=1476199 RepID=UPI000BC7F0E8
MYCSECGKEVNPKAVICTHCGCKIKQEGRSFVVTLLLWFFLGTLGAHRFYTGKIGTGVVQLLLTITIYGLLINIVWLLIDLITILTGSFKDKEGRDLAR